MNNPKQIWLSPECHETCGDGRQWCEDDVWDTCDEPGCECKSVRYVLAADYDALATKLTELEAELQVLKAERQWIPVMVEAVAKVCGNNQGETWLDWLVEGGVSSLAPGNILLSANRCITDDEGSGEVYAPARGQEP